MLPFLSIAGLSLVLTAIYFVPIEIADRSSPGGSALKKTWVWTGWLVPLILLWLSSEVVAEEKWVNPETLVVLAQLAGCVYALLSALLLVARSIRRRRVKNA